VDGEPFPIYPWVDAVAPRAPCGALRCDRQWHVVPRRPGALPAFCPCGATAPDARFWLAFERSLCCYPDRA